MEGRKEFAEHVEGEGERLMGTLKKDQTVLRFN